MPRSDDRGRSSSSDRDASNTQDWLPQFAAIEISGRMLRECHQEFAISRGLIEKRGMAQADLTKSVQGIRVCPDEGVPRRLYCGKAVQRELFRISGASELLLIGLCQIGALARLGDERSGILSVGGLKG